MSDAESESTNIPTLTELPAGLRLFAEGKSVALRHRGDGVFQPIEFPERVWQEENYDLRYHVFTSENERVTVPAVSAIDALAKAGVEKPHKIVRGLAADETIAAVIGAGRLVPVDRPADAPDAGDDAAPEAADADASADPENAESDAEEPAAAPDAASSAESEAEEETA